MPEVEAGERIGDRYLALDRVAEGGFGLVMRASDERLGRIVAITVLPPMGDEHGESRERFEREAQILAQLDHPNIAPIYDFGPHGSQPFFVMKLASGRSLADIDETGPVPEPESVVEWEPYALSWTGFFTGVIAAGRREGETTWETDIGHRRTLFTSGGRRVGPRFAWA
jgi:serine/threonine protein kinase